MLEGKAIVKHNDSQPWSSPGTLHIYEELAACSRIIGSLFYFDRPTATADQRSGDHRRGVVDFTDM